MSDIVWAQTRVCRTVKNLKGFSSYTSASFYVFIESFSLRVDLPASHPQDHKQPPSFYLLCSQDHQNNAKIADSDPNSQEKHYH